MDTKAIAVIAVAAAVSGFVAANAIVKRLPDRFTVFGRTFQRKGLKA